MLQRNGQRDTQPNYREHITGVTRELPTFTVYSQRYGRGWRFGASTWGLLAFPRPRAIYIASPDVVSDFNSSSCNRSVLSNMYVHTKRFPCTGDS